jgi:hypothetical protein
LTLKNDLIEPFEPELMFILYWSQCRHQIYLGIDLKKHRGVAQMYLECRFVPRNRQNNA